MKIFSKIIALFLSFFIISSVSALQSTDCLYTNNSKVGLADMEDKISENSVFLGYSNQGNVQMKHIFKDSKNETFVKWTEGPDEYKLILSGETLAFFTHIKNDKLVSYITGSIEKSKTVCGGKSPKFIQWTSNGQTDFFNSQSLKNQFGFYIERTMKK